MMLILLMIGIFIWQIITHSGKGILIVFLLEGLDLLNIVDEVLDLMELGEGFGRDQIA